MKGVKEGLDYNLYYHEGGKGEAMLKFQIQESQTKLIDKHSLVAQPMFVDHLHGDFGLKPGSPALTLGINLLPLEAVRQMGTPRDPFLKRFPEGVPMGFKQTVKEKGTDKMNNELNL
jgi:hypothetical protein